MSRLARGQSLSGKKPSPSTVRRYLNVLGSVMGTATREWFWLESNPCTKVVRPTANLPSRLGLILQHGRAAQVQDRAV